MENESNSMLGDKMQVVLRLLEFIPGNFKTHDEVDHFCQESKPRQ